MLHSQPVGDHRFLAGGLSPGSGPRWAEASGHGW